MNGGAAMFFLRLAAAMAVAYLLGSVSAAIILTRLVAGRDIRTLGTGNPGTANTGRSLGKGWGALVFFWDGAKTLAPMLAARALFFPADGPSEAFALTAVGLAAVMGHRRPVWHGLRGGGGVACMIFVFCFFIPVETVAALLASAVLVGLVLPHARYKFGRWVPVFAAVLTPLLAWAASALVDIPIAGRVSIGGHPWYVLVCVAAVSLFGLAVNLHTLVGDARKAAAGEGGRQGNPGPW